jgi:hypothetical protein
MINIISTFYISKYSSDLDNERSKELEESLINNLNCENVEKIHLFVDDEEALDRLNLITNSNKIYIIGIQKQPTFFYFFQYILNHLKDKICMITNSDIYLYQCDNTLIENLKNNKLCYALTRYEYDFTYPLIDNYGGSHDCYIFNSSFIDEKIINNHINFCQNVVGIESRIIKNFCDNGFKVLNPCKQIKIVHLHNSGLRNVGSWVGLHRYGNSNDLLTSCWYVPPLII